MDRSWVLKFYHSEMAGTKFSQPISHLQSQFIWEHGHPERSFAHHRSHQPDWINGFFDTCVGESTPAHLRSHFSKTNMLIQNAHLRQSRSAQPKTCEFPTIHTHRNTGFCQVLREDKKIPFFPNGFSLPTTLDDFSRHFFKGAIDVAWPEIKALSDDFRALTSSARRAITRPVNRGLSQTTFVQAGGGSHRNKNPNPVRMVEWKWGLDGKWTILKVSIFRRWLSISKGGIC